MQQPVMEKSTAEKFNRVGALYNTPIFQFYYWWAHAACIRFIKGYIKDSFKILDIACGTGIFLSKLNKRYKNLKLFGIDNSEKLISIAVKNIKEVLFITADASNVPYENSSFDFITIVDAFYYFQDKKIVLKECSRLLKPGQYLFIFQPAIDIFPNIFIKLTKLSSKYLLFNLEEYSEFIKMKELENIANATNLKIISQKIKLLHRFILLKKF